MQYVRPLHMEESSVAQKYTFGDQNTSDVTVLLKNWEDRQEVLYCHSTILVKKSKFFAEQLSNDHATRTKNDSAICIQVPCQGSQYDHYVKLLKLLYVSDDLVLESWDSVRTALGVLQASLTLHCNSIIESCVQYLEAVPWDEKEEEELLKVVPTLGPVATPILARIQPVDLNATKNIFISAIHFATSIERSFPPFTEELKTSAQEQVEYMLLEDEDTPLVTVDEDVISEARTGLGNIFATFETELSASPLDFEQSPEAAEQRVLQSLSDLEWMCGVLSKMEMLKDFVTGWAEISDKILAVVQDEKYSLGFWAVKVKVIEVVSKALDAIGYGSVVLPAPSRVHFLTTWLPYLRKMKPLLDLKSDSDESFAYKLDVDLCQNIEGAIISLILALPSDDQADIFGDWLQRTERLKFPDLSEAFEVWCYRTKTAKRRLLVGLNGVGNSTVSLL
ncbi:BTB/POZ domain-containing protein At3g05675 [Dendrobium catenatum]|uniref:BTB/POZ domain-containing protein n=1 Tax=Dendrobium catenatum TaxID=906689 RepID=A0A2I0X876_9ASPA|nr:BTB/POZ domain-containing protein At3g05675 [Dendrobium catenatum]XP_028549063.1 BTB/POZ domain-containing protein At3g05675 [Dendrobium catenatum]XP_028549064.1 BTB/POZ domain-containing protein At3g05675 [Dendrobium catenatum]XP_028549065.1 BTB/POZ domain-containing protein At3g05675 [Dendrobium catenatum]XP_028549066.1 BTB/POZ domain-containing protein At3g05675 [Dendrobium catenatum]XP_028549067.1 BTB/POZ domain-containing protein At3g05675 [Dendrobium catenatum]PKU84081.1 BTB/POZ doma